ncbi:MAG: hypothetical protein U0R71_04440 [Solirubrobacterales bacterium]
MAWTRAALAVTAAVAVAILVVSGGSSADPRTPAGPAGMPPPFLGTAVAGGGRLTAAVDAYGDVVDLRAAPAGPALIDNSAARQAAGTVPADTGIVPRVRIGGGPAQPLWRADAVTQRYLPGTNVVRTVARFGRMRVVVLVAAAGEELAVAVRAPAAVGVALSVDADRTGWRLCREGCGGLIEAAAAADRRWLARARPLGAGAPAWARAMYERSLLTLRALTARRTGALAAGARDGWAYVWPRDAATAALALQSAGYDDEARRVARFLARLDLDAAARFSGAGEPVAGRTAQGDAAGWLRAAAAATGLRARRAEPTWRAAADYQEGEAGEYLGNAIAAGAGLGPFATPRGLVRRAGDPGSGLDSAAAWAVRPFARPAAFAAVRRTLLRLLGAGTPYGITPGAGWGGGADPWTAPTAWSAWALAALAREEPGSARRRADRAAALRLLADLRRAATAAGSLPERVDATTGVPRSTTPLAWSHAFAVLALRQLWPRR